MENLRYYDKNGREVKEGDTVQIGQCSPQKLYRTADGELGTDATNPVWLETGRAFPCQFGIYPLSSAEIKEMILVEV